MRGDILDGIRDERAVVFGLLHLLIKIGTVDNRTGVALSYEYDSKMDTRQRELFERTKNEILAT